MAHLACFWSSATAGSLSSLKYRNSGKIAPALTRAAKAFSRMDLNCTSLKRESHSTRSRCRTSGSVTICQGLRTILPVLSAFATSSKFVQSKISGSLQDFAWFAMASTITVFTPISPGVDGKATSASSYILISWRIACASVIAGFKLAFCMTLGRWKSTVPRRLQPSSTRKRVSSALSCGFKDLNSDSTIFPSAWSKTRVRHAKRHKALCSLLYSTKSSPAS
mmetsp:Transcript_11303/g.18065  ORF Transcript_11303/g.18065 Transcript_11303/m.18065 type:complete len:222 (-) Transcript_11303:74-739(-)